MQELFHAQRLELPLQLGRAQGLGHSAHQEELDTDRRGRRSRREPLVTRCTGLVWWGGEGDTGTGKWMEERRAVYASHGPQGWPRALLLIGKRLHIDPAMCFAGTFLQEG